MRFQWIVMAVMAFGWTSVASSNDDPVALLDGDGLGSWVEVDYGGQGLVDVVDGVLTLGAGDPLTGIRWDGPLDGGALPCENYRLSFEARRTLGSDFFATVIFPVREDICSLVIGGWGGTQTGLSSLDGRDASENITTDVHSFTNDRWYHITLAVSDQTITATLDQEPLFEPVVIDEHRISTRIEVESCQPLGLSTFLSTGEIRNLTLTRLSPAASKPNEND